MRCIAPAVLVLALAAPVDSPPFAQLAEVAASVRRARAGYRARVVTALRLFPLPSVCPLVLIRLAAMQGAATAQLAAAFEALRARKAALAPMLRNTGGCGTSGSGAAGAPA